jgi:hypothetical protein
MLVVAGVLVQMPVHLMAALVHTHTTATVGRDLNMFAPCIWESEPGFHSAFDNALIPFVDRD